MYSSVTTVLPIQFQFGIEMPSAVLHAMAWGWSAVQWWTLAWCTTNLHTASTRAVRARGGIPASSAAFLLGHIGRQEDH
jgi:hypothetical protein